MTYEIFYIIPSRISDTEVASVRSRVESLVGAAGGKVVQHEVRAKIRLAYPVKGEQYGTYVLLYAEIPNEAVSKVDQDLKLADDVLRHMLVRREEGIPKHTFELTSYQAPITPEGKRTTKRREEAPRRRPSTPTSSRLSLAELDKKLDEILESEVVKGV